MDAVHTHDQSGRIHFESDDDEPYIAGRTLSVIAASTTQKVFASLCLRTSTSVSSTPVLPTSERPGSTRIFGTGVSQGIQPFYLPGFIFLVVVSATYGLHRMRPPDIAASWSVAGRPSSFLSWTPFTYPFNMTQQPAASVPCGFSADGLPVGLQIAGPRHADNAVLAASERIPEARVLATIGAPSDTELDLPSIAFCTATPSSSSDWRSS